MSNKVRKLKQDKGKIRGDMYQPKSLLTLSLILFLVGIACGVGAVDNPEAYNIIIAVIIILLGLFLFLVWKNQKINIISEKEFEYTGVFGKKTVCKFADIKRLYRRSGLSCLSLKGFNILISSTVIMSPELIGLIDNALGVKKNA